MVKHLFGNFTWTIAHEDRLGSSLKIFRDLRNGSLSVSSLSSPTLYVIMECTDDMKYMMAY